MRNLGPDALRAGEGVLRVQIQGGIIESVGGKSFSQCAQSDSSAECRNTFELNSNWSTGPISLSVRPTALVTTVTVTIDAVLADPNLQNNLVTVTTFDRPRPGR